MRARLIIPGHGLPMRDNSYVRKLRAMLAGLRARMAVIGPKEELEQAKKNMRRHSRRSRGSLPVTIRGCKVWFVKYWQNSISGICGRKAADPDRTGQGIGMAAARTTRKRSPSP